MYENGLQRACRRRGLARGIALALTIFFGCAEPRYAPEDMRSSAPDDGGTGEQPGPDAAVPDARAALGDAGRDAGPASFADGGSEDARIAEAAVGERDAGDAGSSTTLADDGGLGAAPPSWAAQLPGSYAVRSYAFADDGTVVTKSEGLMIAEIRRSGNALEMVTQSCKTVAVNDLATITVEKPETLTLRRHRLMFDAQSFSTEAVEVAEGYAAEQVPDCVDKLGQSIAKRPHQKWLASSCKCTAELIPRHDDCRVLDPDDDAHPGYTMFFRTASGLTELRIWGAQANHARFVQMAPRPDRALEGKLEGRSAALQYGCSTSSCADLSGPTPWCASELSSVQFVHLGSRPAPIGGWSCEAVRTREGELFPSLPPQAPTRCSR